MKLVFVTPFDEDDVGGSPDRASGVLRALRERADVETVLLPIRKRPWSPRWRHWWFWEPERSWTRMLNRRASRADAVIATLLPAAAATVRSLDSSQLFVYDAHNDEVRLARQHLPRRAGRDIARLEAAVVGRADVTWVPGHIDAASLAARYPGARLVQLPNGVEEMPDLSRVAATAGRAFTYGSWDYPPNAQALARVLESRPEITGEIHVFGRLPARLRRALEDANARDGPRWIAAGFEPSWIEMVARGGRSAFVAAWSGGGTKLRTVQLAALGVPLACTSEALSGLPERFRDLVCVQEDPAVLIRCALQAGPGSTAAAEELRALVQTNFSWSHLVEAALRDAGLSDGSAVPLHSAHRDRSGAPEHPRA